jgi:hypothetical protein
MLPTASAMPRHSEMAGVRVIDITTRELMPRATTLPA